MDRFDLYYNFAQSQLLEQNERAKFIRTIAMSLMTLNLALLGVAWRILANLTLDTTPEGILSLMFAVVIAVSFVLSILNSLKTLYIADWNVGAHPSELHLHVTDRELDNEQVIEWTAETLTDAYNKNDMILNEKTSDLRNGIFFFWSAVVFVIALGVIAII